MHAWINNVRNLVNRRLIPTMDESTMVFSAISCKFLNLHFEFSLLEWIGCFHLSINEGIKESATSAVDLRSYTSKIAFNNTIKIIFFNFCWVVIILPCSRSTCEYFGVASIFSFCCLQSSDVDLCCKTHHKTFASYRM